MNQSNYSKSHQLKSSVLILANVYILKIQLAAEEEQVLQLNGQKNHCWCTQVNSLELTPGEPKLAVTFTAPSAADRRQQTLVQEALPLALWGRCGISGR